MVNSSTVVRPVRRLLAPLSLVTAALILVGCTNNEAGPGGAAGPSASTDVKAIAKSDKAAALVPEDVAASGVLRIGVDASYAPNQYAGPNGEVVGWEVDLVDAIAAKLGLKTEWSKQGFDKIIPMVTGGTLEMGASSFSDTVERQESVDFIDFYSAGLQFARNTSADDLPNPVKPTDLCGLKVGAQATTTSDDWLKEATGECTAAGKPAIDIVLQDGQDQATSDLALGKTDYMLADSPIAQNSVKQNPDKIALVGDLFDAAPYGWVFPKDGELINAVQAAAQELMDDGTYESILKNWGVEAGAVDKLEINGVK